MLVLDEDIELLISKGLLSEQGLDLDPIRSNESWEPRDLDDVMVSLVWSIRILVQSLSMPLSSGKSPNATTPPMAPINT